MDPKVYRYRISDQWVLILFLLFWGGGFTFEGLAARGALPILLPGMAALTISLILFLRWLYIRIEIQAGKIKAYNLLNFASFEIELSDITHLEKSVTMAGFPIYTAVVGQKGISFTPQIRGFVELRTRIEAAIEHKEFKPCKPDHCVTIPSEIFDYGKDGWLWVFITALPVLVCVQLVTSVFTARSSFSAAKSVWFITLYFGSLLGAAVIRTLKAFERIEIGEAGITWTDFRGRIIIRSSWSNLFGITELHYKSFYVRIETTEGIIEVSNHLRGYGRLVQTINSKLPPSVRAVERER